MFNRIFRRGLSLALAGAVCLSLCACQRGPQKAESTIFAMDTVMTLTLYGKDKASAQKALDFAVSQIYSLERALSVTDEDSALYALNHGEGEWTDVPQELNAVLNRALELCHTTGGALDVTAYPAVRAWGFTTGDYRVPAQAELDELAARIDYSAVGLNFSDGYFLPKGMEIDLGAVAKGFAGGRLTGPLRDAHGVTSALLNLGQSSIQTIGARPDGTPWRVGIQDPAGEGYLGVVELVNMAMGTSGGCQRYFEEDGVRYWHIIDPKTAAPARTGLASVTVVGPDGMTCDGLSTALFVMGLEEGADFWRTHPDLDFDAIFISEDGSINLTAGLEDSFTLAAGYEDREVTILQ